MSLGLCCKRCLISNTLASKSTFNFSTTTARRWCYGWTQSGRTTTARRPTRTFRFRSARAPRRRSRTTTRPSEKLSRESNWSSPAYRSSSSVSSSCFVQNAAIQCHWRKCFETGNFELFGLRGFDPPPLERLLLAHLADFVATRALYYKTFTEFLHNFNLRLQGNLRRNKFRPSL